MTPVVSAILLAAGESKRMGKPKQLMPLGRGTVLEQIVDNFLNSEVSEVIVVLGARAAEMVSLIANRPVSVAINPACREGMSTSIAAGLSLISDKTHGIMLALGTKRRQIVLMVGLESFLLGVMGVVSGSLLGIAVSYYFSFQGISLSAFTEAFESYYVGSTIYPRIFIGNIFVSSAIVLLTSIVISIYPAWKAAKLKPVEAIHHF